MVTPYCTAILYRFCLGATLCTFLPFTHSVSEPDAVVFGAAGVTGLVTSVFTGAGFTTSVVLAVSTGPVIGAFDGIRTICPTFRPAFTSGLALVSSATETPYFRDNEYKVSPAATLCVVGSV